MRAIILAAGRGDRLRPHTDDVPKCLVQLGGASLLSRQLEVLRAATDDIVIVRGYRKESIRVGGVRFVDNPDYATGNSVDSLMTARALFTGDCLVCYADLVYDVKIVDALVAAAPSIGVAVDTAFDDYWAARPGLAALDSESLTFDHCGRLQTIGRPSPRPAEVHGRFIGLLHFDDSGTAAFKDVYDGHAAVHRGRTSPWYHAPSFRSAAMTDMCQAMIDEGIDVTAIPVESGWIEVDTADDLRAYEQWISEGRMGRFCEMLGGDRG